MSSITFMKTFVSDVLVDIPYVRDDVRVCKGDVDLYQLYSNNIGDHVNIDF